MTNIPFSPAAIPPVDTLASVPVPAAPLFDFSDWQAVHPTQPLPGTNVDAEFMNGYTVINNIIERLAMIQRDDGGLQNESVRLETLDPEVMAALDADVAQADAAAAAAQAAAAQAGASEAAAEVAATDAEASAAAAAASELIASQAKADAEAAAANAANSAASIEGLIPDLPGTPGAVIMVDATGDAYTLHEIIPPTTPADAFKSIVVNAAGDGLQFERAMLLEFGATAWNGGGYPIINITDPVDPQDAATKAFVEASIAGAGSVPAPGAGDVNKGLIATGPGAFGWLALSLHMLTDLTAFCRNILETVNDAAGFLAAIGAAPSSQAVPIPANPADDGKALKAAGGAFSWQAITGTVPAPANPADDGKALLAAAGAYGWGAIRQVPAPANPGDNAKVLTANLGAYAWTAIPAVADATNAVKGIIRLETPAEVAAGADKLAALSIGEFAVSKFNSIGRQVYLLGAGALAAHPLTGPTPIVNYHGTGQIYRMLAFADAVTQSAGLAIPLPKKIDVTQPFNVRIRFTAAALGNVLWRLGWSTNGDGEAIAAVMSTVDTVAPNGVVSSTEVTAQIVCAWPAGTVKEDTLYLTVVRVGGDATDTLASIAYLINVELAFITDQATDL